MDHVEQFDDLVDGRTHLDAVVPARLDQHRILLDADLDLAGALLVEHHLLDFGVELCVCKRPLTGRELPEDDSKGVDVGRLHGDAGPDDLRREPAGVFDEAGVG